MRLSNITLVVHDFGSVLGYQFAWKFPDLVARIVSMDIGMGILKGGFPSNPTPSIGDLMGYQQVNIEAFLTNNDTMMRSNVKGTPCARCASITAKTGWPYYNFIMNGTDRWQTRLAPNLALDQWKFSLTPDLPDKPLLFLFGVCNIGTGCKGGPPCTKRDFYFFGTDWVTYMESAGQPAGAAIGSAIANISGAGHWVQCRAASATNAAMDAWL